MDAKKMEEEKEIIDEVILQRLNLGISSVMHPHEFGGKLTKTEPFMPMTQNALVTHFIASFVGEQGAEASYPVGKWSVFAETFLPRFIKRFVARLFPITIETISWQAIYPRLKLPNEPVIYFKLFKNGKEVVNNSDVNKKEKNG